MKIFDETGDAAKAQGWTPMILDTNGNGKRDDYVEPNQPVDPTKDKRIVGGLLCCDAEPGRRLGLGLVPSFPGAVVRSPRGQIHRRPRSRKSTMSRCLASAFAAPTSTSKASSGRRWRAAISASFDRRKCKGPLNGPKATGDHCPEGWSFYQYPGPAFRASATNSAESSYYSWVDQHNTFGLGENVPMSTANLHDGLVAMKDGKMILLTRAVPDGLLRQRASTGASTIRKPAGKAAACGARAATARPG